MSTLPKRQHSVKSTPLKHTPAGAVLTDLIIPIIRLEAHFSRAGESIASTAGQTLARWLTLEMVADRPATVAQIAKRLDLTRQSVQRIADLLAQDRLTEYVDNPAHRTSKLVRLTGRGRRTLSSIQASQRAWSNRVGARIGDVSLRHASSVVEKLTRALIEEPAAKS